MEINKITLMDAYLIETLRSNGVSNDELLNQIGLQDISPWEKVKPNFDFTGLLNLYEQDPKAFASILFDGYTVKFITMNGLQNLLEMKFDKIKERDFQLTDKGVSYLNIDEDIYPVLKQMLSKNWIIHELSEHDSSHSMKDIHILLA